MRTLPIVWQRLVSSEGKTCVRCDASHQELLRAVSKLKEALNPLGIEPTLETRELDEASFKVNPSESNRVWIAGSPMEAWLGAGVGSSRCCAVCGESECRTIKVGGSEFEAIPEHLLLSAALVAASRLLAPTSETQPRPGG
ncbi:DUF2703 domain-containing protein [Anaeromyxobacter terrae]|uniref:DUF2703 domain-containing protein n=1 Tax=Anaeromyxobacter terrae TaxID=2925406 RepID=UPI001F59236F|nr:DUF2703 domain-containing protein [Anaeromyxobacter sp. SG22]